jgi:hypothetical protein
MKVCKILAAQGLCLLENVRRHLQRKPGECAANVGYQARVVKTRFGHVCFP